MRIIAIIKECLEYEKKLILSSVEKEDKVLLFDNEKELLKSEDCANIEIVFDCLIKILIFGIRMIVTPCFAPAELRN